MLSDSDALCFAICFKVIFFLGGGRCSFSLSSDGFCAHGNKKDNGIQAR